VALRSLEVLGFGDLAVGDEWVSPARTVTEADVSHFAALTGDFNPIHVDHESARRGPFRRPVAHGLLGLSFAAGLTSISPRVDTLAFLGILEWTFHKPIFFGDTIRVLSRVEAVEPRAKGRRGVVTWHRRIVNQADAVVQEGRTQTLVRSKSSAPAGGGTEPGPEMA
jgi:3-hydroxybutyryl-CoA dehydratase